MPRQFVQNKFVQEFVAVSLLNLLSSGKRVTVNALSTNVCKAP